MTKTKSAAKTELIPVVSDLPALHRWAARKLCEVARCRSVALGDFTLSDLRTALEKDLIELEQAIEELGILIMEEGDDQKALRLDLDPAKTFERLREMQLMC